MARDRQLRKKVGIARGFELLPWEVVHHKDRNPSNNLPENLEIVDEVDHRQFHRKDSHRANKLAAQASYVRLEAYLNDQRDILWSHLAQIDLSEIAR